MADDIHVSIEGEPTSGRAQKTVAEINAEADAWAAKTAQYKRETAYYRQQSAQAVRENLETTAHLLNTERQSAEAELREAVEYADSDKIIGAQRTLNNIEARHRQNEYALHQANSRPADPVEAYAHGRDPRAAAWLRRNPQFVTDQRLNFKLQAADADARAEGHAPNTDGYFAHVEKFVELRGASDGDSVQSPRARQQAQRSSPNKVTIRMTAEEKTRLQETAESLGIPFNEYLRRKYVMDNSPEWNWRQEFGG
jgi:hypothetical protein